MQKENKQTKIDRIHMPYAHCAAVRAQLLFSRAAFSLLVPRCPPPSPLAHYMLHQIPQQACLDEGDLE